MNYFPVLSPERNWGIADADGNYTTGLLGQLQRGEVDFSVTGYSATYERKKHFDFLRPVIYTQSRLYIKNPKSDFNWMTFVAPLSGEIWLCLVIAAVLVPFCLTLSTQLQRVRMLLTKITVKTRSILI